MKMPHRVYLLLLIFCLAEAKFKAPIKSAITNLPGSRLGDHIISYCKCKWIAYVYDLDFVFNPFDQSDKFMLYDLETERYSRKKAKDFRRKVRLSKLPPRTRPNTLYVAHYGTYIPEINPRSFDTLTIEDQNFIEMLKEYIAPRYPMDLIQPPSDRRSLAVHVRRGGGFDLPILSRGDRLSEKNQRWADQIWPTKFPPYKYYLDQIRYIYHHYNSEDLYVFIFTDDPDPLSIVKTFREALPHNNIAFDCRATNNHVFQNTTIEDFFSITLFNCLIRPNSGFTVCAQLIGDFDMVISPRSYYWNNTNDILTIDTVYIDHKKKYDDS